LWWYLNTTGANEEGTGVEIIDPPAGSVPGDVVTIPGFSAPEKLPDKQLNLKKKVLDALLPDLFTNDTGTVHVLVYWKNWCCSRM
jgi:hypothetical protein